MNIWTVFMAVVGLTLPMAHAAHTVVLEDSLSMANPALVGSLFQYEGVYYTVEKFVGIRQIPARQSCLFTLRGGGLVTYPLNDDGTYTDFEGWRRPCRAAFNATSAHILREPAQTVSVAAGESWHNIHVYQLFLRGPQGEARILYWDGDLLGSRPTVGDLRRLANWQVYFLGDDGR